MTTGPLTAAREHVATALSAASARVYPVPVETPSYPCLQISASSSWIVRPRLAGGKVDVGITVRVAVAVVSGNAEALAKLEDLVWEAMGLIPISGEIAAPRLDTSDQTNIYMVDLPTMVTASE